MGQGMNEKGNTSSVSSEAQAKVLRAFFDAAEKILAVRYVESEASQEISLAIADLEKVFTQADELGSEEFSKSLKTAADAYFSRVAALNPIVPAFKTVSSSNCSEHDQQNEKLC